MIEYHELTEADRDLVGAAESVVRRRYVPRWNSVGAAVRTKSGKTYAAVHLDAAVGRVAVCAEMIALGMAVAAGDQRIEAIVAVTRRGENDWEILPPCGMCRELLSDYAPDAMVIVPAARGSAKVVLADLLPIKREAAEAYPPLGIGAERSPGSASGPEPKNRPRVQYTEDLSGITADRLRGGFFEGWRLPPSPELHLAHLRGAEVAIVAIDSDADLVVGFVTAIGDGALTAFIPLLEVLPAYRGRGIGAELVRLVLARLRDRYSIDLVCDAELVPFYEGLGGAAGTAVMWRNSEAPARRPSP